MKIKVIDLTCCNPEDSIYVDDTEEIIGSWQYQYRDISTNCLEPMPFTLEEIDKTVIFLPEEGWYIRTLSGKIYSCAKYGTWTWTVNEIDDEELDTLNELYDIANQ